MSRQPDPERLLIADAAAEWFVMHRTSTLTAVQREAFVRWLRASPEHVREYLALTGLADDVGRVAKRFTIAESALLERAQQEAAKVGAVIPLPRSYGLPQANKHDEHGARPRAMLAAAAVVVALAVMLSIGWMSRQAPEYVTAHAEQRSWRLSDGSTVHLNSASKIKIHFDAAQRRVELVEGQAIFRVAKDSARPFSVQAGNVEVSALGTEFDVYRRTAATTVSVIEGSVAVWSRAEMQPLSLRESSAPTAPQATAALAARNADFQQEHKRHAPLVLSAGEQARVAAAAAEVSQKSEDVRKAVAWLQRQIVFERDTLATAVDEFNRYSDTRIRIVDAEIAAMQINGIFSVYDVESFMRFLQRQPGMRLEYRENEIVVGRAQSPR